MLDWGKIMTSQSFVFALKTDPKVFQGSTLIRRKSSTIGLMIILF